MDSLCIEEEGGYGYPNSNPTGCNPMRKRLLMCPVNLQKPFGRVVLRPILYSRHRLHIGTANGI